MLQSETKDRLKVLGFDVSKLEEAVKSEEEQSLEVPTLYNEDQKNTFGKNRFDEGKQAFSEIKAKEIKTNYNLDIDGKDIDNVISKLIDRESKTTDEPNKEIERLKADNTGLQSKLQDQVKANESLTSEYQSNLFDNKVNSEILGLIDKDKTIFSPDDLLTIYRNKRGIESVDGRTVVKKGGDVIKDDVLNPVSLKDDFNSFLHEGNYLRKEGMNGDDRGGGGSAKFKDMDSFMVHCDKNNIEPMSEEGQKLLIENKDF